MDEAPHLRAAERVRPERLAQLDSEGFLAYNESDDTRVSSNATINGWGKSQAWNTKHIRTNIVPIGKFRD